MGHKDTYEAMINYHIMGAGGPLALVGSLLAMEEYVGLQLGEAVHFCKVVEEAPV